MALTYLQQFVINSLTLIYFDNLRAIFLKSDYGYFHFFKKIKIIQVSNDMNDGYNHLD